MSAPPPSRDRLYSLLREPSGHDPRDHVGRIYQQQILDALRAGQLKPEWQKLWG